MEISLPPKIEAHLTFPRLCILAALALAGCGSKDAHKGRGGDDRPAQVGYVVVQPTSVPVVTELAGRTAAYQTSEVRPQVTGIIQRRLFTEGSLVRKGQPLYQIDPRAYRAAASQAQANLSSAQANAEATRIRADRYRPLAEMEAVSKQDYTDAAAQARQAAASVAQTRAALDAAKVSLDFTTVPAPITGRIGRSIFTEGALVTASQADPLTTIQRLDPIYVDIQQSSSDLLSLRRALSTGGVVAAQATVRLKLDDGSDYGYAGTVEFAEAMVDTSTGTVTLRARFPNPQGFLLPGLFVRATFAQAIDTNAFLVPQQAVSRTPLGAASLFVVGPGNKAVERPITADRAQGAFWVVTSGLRPGDKVITQGLANVKAGAVIKPVPANAPQRIVPPKPGDKQAQSDRKRG